MESYSSENFVDLSKFIYEIKVSLHLSILDQWCFVSL